MTIVRAIERITRRAQQGGIIAVLTGLGEELRGEAIPAPLRQVAQRVATLLDGQRPALLGGASGAQAPAVVVNVAVAVAVGAAPPEDGDAGASDGTSKPVVATAVAMSPQAQAASADTSTDDEAPSPEGDDGEAGEAAWRSGLAPRT